MLAMPWRGVGSCTRHSGLPSPNENERCRLRRRCPPAHCPQYRVEHHVEFLADVFSEEAQYEISVLLKQLIFAPIAAIGDWIGERKSATFASDDERWSTTAASSVVVRSRWTSTRCFSERATKSRSPPLVLTSRARRFHGSLVPR